MSKLHYVITGASRGIGLELTRQALQAGHHVSALVRSPEKAEKLQKLAKESGNSLRVFKVDVLSEDSIESFSRELGGEAIDVLINNAGILLDGDTPFENVDLGHVRESFDVNTIAPMLVTQILLPALKKSSEPKLVNVTSLMGSIADNGYGHSYGYRMSKAALNMFTKTFAVDHKGITAFVVHPGWVKTDMGGSEAPTQPEESAAGILKKITSSGPKNSGHFYDFEGDELPW